MNWLTWIGVESLRAGDVQEVTTGDKEIVTALNASLAQRLGQARYHRWFGANATLALDDERLCVTTPNQFFQDWLRRNFRDVLNAACQQVLGRVPRIEFQIDSATRTAASAEASPPQSPAASSPVVEEPSTLRLPSRTSEAAPRRRFESLDSFVVGESNGLAHTAASMAAQQPGQLSPLFVYGPTGVGKTHLLEGIWSQAARTTAAGRAVFLTAEQFTTLFLGALHGSGLPSFRRKYRGVELLLIDDIQFFVRKRATLVELLYTVNTLLDAGRQLVFSADRPPAQLEELGSELVGRLEGGMVCQLDPPDADTRRGILRKLAGQLEVDLPEEVERFVAQHVSSHARALCGAIQRLKATSQAQGRAIDVKMAEAALSDIVRQRGRVVRLADIEKVVCDTFGLEPRSLQSDGKARQVSHPRMLAMWLARKHTRAALAEIGSYFGRRSHTTVLSAQRRVNSWMADRESLVVADRTLEIDALIRDVEMQLRIG